MHSHKGKKEGAPLLESASADVTNSMVYSNHKRAIYAQPTKQAHKANVCAHKSAVPWLLPATNEAATAPVLCK